MNKVIVVNGFPEAGKDEFTYFCINELAKRGYTGKMFSSVDNVKEAATILGWDKVKDARGREFLSILKTLSSSYYDGPFTYISQVVLSNPEVFLFIHIREPKEIARVVAEFGAKTLLVMGKRQKTEFQNTGDSVVMLYKYDYVVYNNGTLLELEKESQKFVDFLLVDLTIRGDY